MKIQILKILIFIVLLIPQVSNGAIVVQTDYATNVEDTTATLNGGSFGATHAYFRYSIMTRPPVFCNEIFGNNMKYTGDLSSGGVSYDLTGLIPNTKYYYCLIASNEEEISYNASVQSFTTKPCKTCPQTTIKTLPAIVLDTNSATLRGEYTSVKPVVTYFEHKKATNGAWEKTPEENHGADSIGKINFSIKELTPNTQYEFRAVARTEDPVATFFGNILTFKTLGNNSPLDETDWIYEETEEPVGPDPIDGPDVLCPEGWTGVFPDCVPPPWECPEGWTGEYPVCVQEGQCPEGYTGTYPICLPPENCPDGWTGEPPNCIAPEFPCPDGWSGESPNCVSPPLPCPDGWTGEPPNCVSETGGNECPDGWSGTSPNCIAPPFPCPEGWAGESPNCTIIPGETPCPEGYTGTYPNCSYAGSCPPGWNGTYPVCTSPNDNNQCPPLWTGTYPICLNPNDNGGGDDNGSDMDGDGIPNVIDNDADGDDIPNSTDPDDDNDGIPDISDNSPTGPGDINDYDNDGTPNILDWDIDGDNIPNVIDGDTDGDGIPNSTDPDDDNDKILDIFDKSHTGIGTFKDFNGDGIPNSGQSSGGQGGGVLGGNNNTESKLGDIVVPPNDAIVRYHEGVETVFIRQIKRNTVLQQKYGHKEGADLQAFANYLAHFFGKNYGYVAKDRKEVRVRYPDVAAYELREIGGATIVYESYKNNITGNFEITGIRKLNSIFKLIFKYEYYFLKRR